MDVGRAGAAEAVAIDTFYRNAAAGSSSYAASPSANESKADDKAWSWPAELADTGIFMSAYWIGSGLGSLAGPTGNYFGGIAGCAVGGAAGKYVEQQIRGEPVSVARIASSAVSGALVCAVFPPLLNRFLK